MNKEDIIIAEPVKVKPKASKASLWCFTDFKEENLKTGYQTIFDENKDIIRAIAWGSEICPTTKKKHNQGFIQVYTTKRTGYMQNLLNSKCHLEPCRGSIKDNVTYCAKEGQYTSIGEFVSRGCRTDLEHLRMDIKDGQSNYEIMEKYTGDYMRYHSGIEKVRTIYEKEKGMKLRLNLNVIVLIGKAGVGKTRYVLEKHGMDNVYIVDCGGDSKFLFNGYDNEKVLLIDDFNGWIQYTYLLRILDIYPLKLNVKNGIKYALWDTVYITSNAKPVYWYQHFSDNLKRRIGKCLKVTKGNTETLVHPYKKIFNEEFGKDEYGNE